MKTGYISNLAMFQTSQRQTLALQNNLVKAQSELATGRHQDIGLALGHKTEVSLSVRQNISALDSIKSELALSTSRYDMMDQSLSDISTMANDMMGTLIASRNSEPGPGVAQSSAKVGLAEMMQRLNTTFNGAGVFSGINLDEAVFGDYFSDPKPDSAMAVEDSFVAKFGFTQDDPAVANITASDMEDYLDTEFSAEFDDANWQANWSTAIDGKVTTRLAPDKVVGLEVNANKEPFKNLIKALTMVADLGTQNLNKQAFQAVTDKALNLISNASEGVVNMRGDVGVMQSRIERADNSMTRQMSILNTSLSDLEGVDPFEASTRVNQLVGQIEVSYTLTGRLQQLSLMNYL